MRYLKRQTLDRRSANNTTLYSDAARTNITMAPVGAGNLYLQAMNGAVQLPTGSNAQQPAGANGMMRYNTDVVTGGRVEVYSAGRWRALSFVEQKQITQQNLGAGDSNNTYFGPLNSTYYNPGNNANNATVGGQNILVIVENVIQVSTINYTIVQNPTLPTEIYAPKLSFAATVGSTTLYFNTSLLVTGASGNGTTAVLTFATQTQAPFAIGASIVVTGIASTGGVGNYNGTFTVTASTTGSVSFASATTATYQNGGQIDAVGSVFPSVDLTGASITGTNIPASTTISSYVTDPNTDALIKVVISNPTTTSTIAVNTIMTITKTGALASGYYLNFSTAVPYGKVVIALLGFDQ